MQWVSEVHSPIKIMRLNNQIMINNFLFIQWREKSDLGKNAKYKNLLPTGEIESKVASEMYCHEGVYKMP